MRSGVGQLMPSFIHKLRYRLLQRIDHRERVRKRLPLVLIRTQLIT